MFKKLISMVFKKQEIERSDFIGAKFCGFVRMYEKIEKNIDEVLLSNKIINMSKEDLSKLKLTIEESITELQGGLIFCKLGLKNRSKAVLMKDWRDNIKAMKKTIQELMYYRKNIGIMVKYSWYDW